MKFMMHRHYIIGMCASEVSEILYFVVFGSGPNDPQMPMFVTDERQLTLPTLNNMQKGHFWHPLTFLISAM
jgi:hypothetical protein